VEALTEIQTALGLAEPPSRIECYDISNIQGTSATGSMVVFVQGAPSKQDYRHFRIKTVEGANDYASMAEVLKRRFRRASEPDAARSIDGKENRWAIMPDLVIIDGGKGQLSAALEAMQEAGVAHIATVGLAKQHEEIFKPGRAAPIILAPGSQGLYLVQRIRDEAHRFAITGMRSQRAKVRVGGSRIEEVPGVGPKKRASLLRRFGGVRGVADASVEDLMSVDGISRDLAEAIYRALR